jgi:hypothetical protein
MPLTTLGATLINRVLPAAFIDENPFVKQKDGTYIMRADACEVNPIFEGSHFLGYYFRYLWRGKFIYEDRLVSPSPAQQFTMANCEIRFRFSKTMGVIK